MGEILLSIDVAGVQHDRASISVDGGIQLQVLFEGNSQVVVGHGIVGISRDRSTIGDDRPAHVPQILQHIAKIVLNDRVSGQQLGGAANQHQ